MSAVPPLRCCLLSGGESRRMGRDKALLHHPEGCTWLERNLRLLSQLGAPVTLLSRHPEHLERAEAMGCTAMAEPPPWQGPLLALHRLMQQYPDQRLLLCPVDMPNLSLEVLATLLAAAEYPAAEAPAATAPSPAIQLAHDGERLQPLLGLYPSCAALRDPLAYAVGRGERRLQGWLATQLVQPALLDRQAIRNVNRPEANQLAASTDT